ncbi:MAG: L-lactate dehydrogenase [Clostridia bacterium]|nr:L-lactate dehydrogenase [Clostridia bacterium]
MNKITVIGTGYVGSTIAYTLTVMGIASDIVLIDINKDKALGEAIDIKQGTPYCSPCSIYAGSYPDAAGSDIVIITSGVARKPGQTRLDLAQININILNCITPEITKYAPDAMYIIVSNPVDILTYVFCKRSGLPEEHIIGSGTILDTSRLRSRLSDHYNINQKNVHAYVLGEHGDSSFIPWSMVNISNVPIKQFSESLEYQGKNYPPLDFAELEMSVRQSGSKVIGLKGATFYAVSMAVCHICQCLLSSVDMSMPISTMLHGEYGIEDVCLSIVNVIGKRGVEGKILLPLNDTEVALLRKSADRLKETLRSVDY